MQTVISNWEYVLLALLVSTGIFTIVIGIQNWQLLSSLWSADFGTLWQKLALSFTLYLSISSNFTLLSGITTVITSALFGTSIALLIYYAKTVQNVPIRMTGIGISSFGGMLSGLLGIGCAACGTFLFSQMLLLFGTGWLLTWLPLKGEEFGLLGVILLIYTNYLLVKKIREPLVCPT